MVDTDPDRTQSVPVTTVRLVPDIAGLLGVSSVSVGTRLVSVGTITALSLHRGVLVFTAGEECWRVLPGVGVVR
jgi:hypothetical protein